MINAVRVTDPGPSVHAYSPGLDPKPDFRYAPQAAKRAETPGRPETSVPSHMRSDTAFIGR